MRDTSGGSGYFVEGDGSGGVRKDREEIEDVESESAEESKRKRV